MAKIFKKIETSLHLNKLSLSQKILLFIAALSLGTLGVFASLSLRKSAGIKLGTTHGLSLSADKKDSLGIFSDSTFTLRSDTDLSPSTVKDNIIFFPEIEFDVDEISPRQFTITPKKSLDDNKLYRIQVLSDQKNFSWAFQTKDDFRVVQSLPGNQATYVPTNSGIEITFSHESYEDLSKYFEITPKTEGRFEKHFRTTVFVPKSLQLETLYTVKIKKGLKLEGTQSVLAEDHVFQFETRTTESSPVNLGFARQYYEFSTTDTPAFDIWTSLKDSSLQVKAFQYASPQNFQNDMINKLSLPGWAHVSGKKFKVDTSKMSKVMEFDTKLEVQNYSNYFIFPQSLPKGYYVVEVASGDIRSQVLVQITDISTFSTVSGNKTLVWVNDIKNGSYIKDAQVSFLGKTTKTDSQGIAYFDTPNPVYSDTDIIVISAPQGSLYVPIKSSSDYWGDKKYQIQRRENDKYWSYFYTDRPVYLPDDVVKFWGLLRDRNDLNKSQKFTLEVTRSDYFSLNFTPITVFSKDYQTSDFGTFIGEIPLQSFKPGWYGISVKINDTTVLSSGMLVQTYVKPAYKITLQPDKKVAIVGESLNFSGQASFFEGSPVSGLELKYHGLKNGHLISDSKGQFSFSFTPTSESVPNSYSPSYQYFSINPVNEEEAAINADTSVAIFSSSLVFGQSNTSVKDGQGHVEVNLKQVDTAAYTKDGNIDNFAGVPNQTVTGELVENVWIKREIGTYYDFISKTTMPRYEYSTQKNKISDLTLTSESNGKIAFQFPVKNDRGYGIMLKATDAQGRTTAKEVYLHGNNSWAYRHNTYIYLSTPKANTADTYLINEPVDLSVKMGTDQISSSDSDKFLYLFAQQGIKSFQVSNDSSLSLKFSDAFVPNVLVKAVRFTGNTYQITDGLNLLFDTSVKKLNIGISLDKNQYLPGSDANLSVEVRDNDGSPVSAEVNLNLVDEAYSSLFSTSVNPLGSIYRSLSDDIISTYYSHRSPLAADGIEGGGCFLPGTKVTLSNGTFKNIEDVKVGDQIRTLSRPDQNRTVEAKVSQVFKHTVAGYLVINNHLRVTSEHNLYVNGRWMTAGEIRVGDMYLSGDGSYHLIRSVDSYSGQVTVYNLAIEKYATYLADGFYVHNEKGRDLFVDIAYFGSLRTGLDGKASVSIKLPDNLTSWKIISQSVTKDLKAGDENTLLTVKQPFFVDMVMNTEYLAGDKPVLVIRAYGDGLTAGSDVSLNVSSKELGLSKDLTAKAFEPTKVDLGRLKEGTVGITVTAKSGSYSDKITRKISVVGSRLKTAKVWSSVLSPDTKISGSSDSQTTLTFMDMSLGRFLPPLTNLSYTWGDRLDQRLTRSLSGQLINRYFDSRFVAEDLKLDPYLDPTGGYSLFPYSQGDVELSAFAAALVKEKVSSQILANFFYQKLSKIQEDVVFAQSLFGLASLDEPVLVLIDNFASQKNLSPFAKIYLGLAQASIGDTEKSRLTYSQIISDYAVSQDQLLYLKVGSTKDDYLKATSLAAALASMLSEKEVDRLLSYTYANSTKDVLIYAPQLLSIKHRLAQEKPQNITFAYTLDGKKVSKKLANGESFSLEVSPKDLSQITFSDIEGTVGVISVFQKPITPESIVTNSAVSVGRSYSVKGVNTNIFNGSDYVKVTLPVKLAESTQDGCYQITDILPSGLRPVVNIYKLGLNEKDVWYPYEINGQKVSFCVGKGTRPSSINYYARVVSGGDYIAESALIQSQISPSLLNLSPASSVVIK